MNKKLLTQIKNEWRSNLWLVTELLLVSVVMWYIVDYMYVKAAVYYEPRGFDISHCYLIQMGRLTDKSPDFIPNQTKEQQREDVKGLAERLKYRPDIEAVGFGQNSYPYNGSNSGTEVRYDTLQSPGWTIRRLVVLILSGFSSIMVLVGKLLNNWRSCLAIPRIFWLPIIYTRNVTEEI